MGNNQLAKEKEKVKSKKYRKKFKGSRVQMFKGSRRELALCSWQLVKEK
ncbi:MAG: hypothetical protein AB9834_08965 [Lentimicrobium sp.]